MSRTHLVEEFARLLARVQPRVSEAEAEELVEAVMAEETESTPAPASVPAGSPDIPPSYALPALVHILLERALEDRGSHPLLRHFTGEGEPEQALQDLADFTINAYPIIIIESHIPFIEELAAKLVLLRLPKDLQKKFAIQAAEVSPSDETKLRISWSRLEPGIQLVPLHAYRGVEDLARVSHEFVKQNVAIFIGCDRIDDVPEALRRLEDLRLKLDRLDVGVFRDWFTEVINAPPPGDWQTDADRWAPYVLPSDFEQPIRLKMAPADALVYIRSEVAQRLANVVPDHALELHQLHGLGEAKQIAEDLIADIRAAAGRDPARRLAWSDVDRGMLLVGPPGTGKTTLAQAIAKGCGIKFVRGSAADWQAAGALPEHIRAIRACFAEARRYAPAILFIDEIDSLGNRERLQGHNAQYQIEVINTVLEQIQGLDPKAPLIIIGATNYAENVDPALRRSGRLDRVIAIPRPNSESLGAIYALYLARQFPGGQLPAGVFNLKELGGLSLGLTGADVEQKVRGAARRARKEGRSLGQADLLAEITGRPLDRGSSIRLTADDLDRTAIHESGHALAMYLGSQQGRTIGYISIIPRADGTLGFVKPLPDERVSLTRRDYLEELTVWLAGRAAEELAFGTDGISSGASSDLRAATSVATRMITQSGLGPRGTLRWTESPDASHLEQVEALLQETYARTLELLQAHEDPLRTLARTLREREELAGSEVLALLRAAD